MRAIPIVMLKVRLAEYCLPFKIYETPQNSNDIAKLARAYANHINEIEQKKKKNSRLLIPKLDTVLNNNNRLLPHTTSRNNM